MFCSLSDPVQAPRTPTATKALVVWPKWLLRGLVRWRRLRQLVAFGAGPCFPGVVAVRPSIVWMNANQIVERGKMTMAWLFRGNLLKKAVVASLAINVVLAGVFLAVRRRRGAALALILLHLLMLELPCGRCRSTINFASSGPAARETQRQWQHLRA